jgi:TPP-dependent pyruvate/acetoin dehydrogenase alpha subunit
MALLSKLDSTMYEAQRQGRISFYMPNHGELAAQIGRFVQFKNILVHFN